MKIYVFTLVLLAIVFWGNTYAMIWLSGISLFIPFKYAKDFVDKRLH